MSSCMLTEAVSGGCAAVGNGQWSGTSFGLGQLMRWWHSYPTAAREIWKSIHQNAGQVCAIRQLLSHCWLTSWASSRTYQNYIPFCKIHFHFMLYSAGLICFPVGLCFSLHEVISQNSTCIFFIFSICFASSSHVNFLVSSPNKDNWKIVC